MQVLSKKAWISAVQVGALAAVLVHVLPALPELRSLRAEGVFYVEMIGALCLTTALFVGILGFSRVSIARHPAADFRPLHVEENVVMVSGDPAPSVAMWWLKKAGGALLTTFVVYFAVYITIGNSIEMIHYVGDYPWSEYWGIWLWRAVFLIPAFLSVRWYWRYLKAAPRAGINVHSVYAVAYGVGASLPAMLPF